jgi:hypothetical protein
MRSRLISDRPLAWSWWNFLEKCEIFVRIGACNNFNGAYPKNSRRNNLLNEAAAFILEGGNNYDARNAALL